MVYVLHRINEGGIYQQMVVCTETTAKLKEFNLIQGDILYKI
jgi:hypothetical protein